MNPYPFASLNHFTLPVAIHCLLLELIDPISDEHRRSVGVKVQAPKTLSRVNGSDACKKRANTLVYFRSGHDGSNASNARGPSKDALVRVFLVDSAQREHRHTECNHLRKLIEAGVNSRFRR